MSPSDTYGVFMIVFALLILALVAVPVVLYTEVWRLLGKKQKYQTRRATPVWIGREAQSGCRIIMWDGDSYEEKFYTWYELVGTLDGDGKEWAKARLEEYEARREVGQ